MYCTKCGTQHDETDRFCFHCGAALAAPSMPLPPILPPQPYPAPPALRMSSTPYLVIAILETILCGFFAWPFSIPAIVYASIMEKKLRIGDFEGAYKASKRALLFLILGVSLYVLIIIVSLVFSSIYSSIGNV